MQQRVSTALEERAQDRLQAQRGVWIYNAPSTSASLFMPLDNERKHGGVVIHRFCHVILRGKRKE
jgi:hypothetical protein